MQLGPFCRMNNAVKAMRYHHCHQQTGQIPEVTCACLPFYACLLCNEVFNCHLGPYTARLTANKCQEEGADQADACKCTASIYLS